MVCLTEYWFNEDDIKHLKIGKYKISSAFTRKFSRQCEALVAVREDIETEDIDIKHLCNEKDAEMAATIIT